MMLNPFRARDLVRSVGNLPAFVGFKFWGVAQASSVVVGVPPQLDVLGPGFPGARMAGKPVDCCGKSG